MCAGDGDDGVHLAGIEDGPLEALHPAERSARHRRQPLDPELVEKGALGSHHIGDGDDRKVRSVRHPGRRIE